jgi:glycosyltransferase involved in cell wall biosynthesis
MKVLFVSGGNSQAGIIPFVKSQGESLINEGIELVYFTIKGRGVKGYLKNIFLLKKYLKNNKFNIVHAHYSLTAFVVSIAMIGNKIPIVVSLMGSDSESSKLERFIIRVFNLFFWTKLIVKSDSMAQKMKISNVDIIPNGINQRNFRPITISKAKEKLGIDSSINYVLFAADTTRYSKNFELANQAFLLANIPDTELLVINGVSHKEMVLYLNACSVVLLTSRYEGSPNIIKEAMACNRPIVSTKVGDVNWVIGDTKGCFIVDNTVEGIADSLVKAVKYSLKYGVTNGVERINKLYLGDVAVANRLINLYSSIL